MLETVNKDQIYISCYSVIYYQKMKLEMYVLFNVHFNYENNSVSAAAAILYLSSAFWDPNIRSRDHKGFLIK